MTTNHVRAQRPSSQTETTEVHQRRSGYGGREARHPDRVRVLPARRSTPRSALAAIWRLHLAYLEMAQTARSRQPGPPRTVLEGSQTATARSAPGPGRAAPARSGAAAGPLGAGRDRD